MRIRGIVAALAIACAGLAAPPASAADSVIVLKGARSGWVDLTLPQDAAIHDVTITTKGRYAGYYAKNLTMTMPQGKSPNWFAGELLLPAFAEPGRAAAQVNFGIPRLYAGTVRLYLIADGPTTVRIPVDGVDLHANLTPKKRAASGYTAGPLSLTTDGWLRHAGVDAGPTSVAFTALLAEGDALAAAETEVCVNDGGSCPALVRQSPGQAAGPEAVPYTGRARIWAATTFGTTGVPRRRTARFRLAHELAVSRALGVAVTLTLA